MNPKTLNFAGLLVLALWLATFPAHAAAPTADAVQAVAYYFPDWTRPPGNKERVFAEWWYMENAVPRFPGHEQPKKPLWGYEDESDPAVMAKKVAVAAEHGLSAFVFCWYHHAQGSYLERALHEGYLKATNRARLPFAIMWANHDIAALGRMGAVTPEVFDKMTDVIVRDYFSRPEYWRIDGRCYFSIYQPMTFIDGMGGTAAARAALDAFRKKAEAAGAGGLHLNLVDFELNKQPNAMVPVRDLAADSVTSYVWIHAPAAYEKLTFPKADFDEVKAAYFASWDKWWGRTGLHFPHVTMGWDPTPRLRRDQPHTGAGYPDTPVITGNSPERFKAALLEARARAEKLPAGQRIVSIYAWNEWSEGGYLEPEARTGNAYLDAVKDVFGARAIIPQVHQQAPVDFSHPPREYVAHRLHGWEVLVEKQLADEDAVTAKATLGRVEKKLGEIAALLPPATLPDLRKLKVFILYGTKAKAGGRGNGLEYFPADAPAHHDWLDARMGRSIVIFDAANYFKLSEAWALKSLVHEFGHAQHLDHWPEDHAAIHDAWRVAMKAGRYQVVRDEDKGTHFPNYAAMNHLEYFAELTAMYFVGANYFPKDRAGLKAYDPEGFALIEKLWGVHEPPPTPALSAENK